MKRTTREARGGIIAQERHKVFMALKKATFEEAERAYLELEKRLLREAVATSWERQQVKRLIAKDIFVFAYGSDVTREQLVRALRRVERVGYSDLWMRVLVANLFVQMVPSFPQKARQAFAMLEDAERRLLRLRKRDPLRKDGLRASAHARKVAAEGGIPPPAPASRPRSRSAR
jgi:hypothetical protein